MSTIVIGVDATERAEDAIAFGGRVAAATGARIVVAAAYHHSDVPSLVVSTLREEARRTAEQMRERLGADADLRIVPGSSPAHALHDVAGAERAELIVVGSTHTGKSGRVVPGSTGERLLHGAPCAVAVVPNGYREQTGEPIRRVGVAYNASPEARAAVTAAAGLARAFGAELEVIGVVGPELDGSLATLGATIDAEARVHMQQNLDEIAGEVPGATTTRLDGIPADALAKHSAWLDLLVTGSRGYGPLRSVLLGGCSGRLMRTAYCPVLVVPRGVEAPLAELLEAAAV